MQGKLNDIKMIQIIIQKAMALKRVEMNKVY